MSYKKHHFSKTNKLTKQAVGALTFLRGIYGFKTNGLVSVHLISGPNISTSIQNLVTNGRVILSASLSMSRKLEVKSMPVILWPMPFSHLIVPKKITLSEVNGQ